MKVSIVKDWGDPDILRQTPGGRGIWDGIEFTTGNPLVCDLEITLNMTPSNHMLICRKGGRWLMSQEPPHEFYHWQTRAFHHFDRVYTFWDKQQVSNDCTIIHDQTCLPWHVGKTYDELISITPDQLEKKDSVSWVTSNLNNRPGHALRLDFMRFLQGKNFPFDLFGRGFKLVDDKWDVIAPYKYSLAIENFPCNDYWTEKIADCFLSWTMPIYYGCTNITNYFPTESMILIDPQKPEEALYKIQEALDTNIWKERLPHIAAARELVLNKYQFFPAIAERIRKSVIPDKKRIFWMRRPNEN
jgi:hypothetical protein